MTVSHYNQACSEMHQKMETKTPADNKRKQNPETNSLTSSDEI